MNPELDDDCFCEPCPDRPCDMPWDPSMHPEHEWRSTGAAISAAFQGRAGWLTPHYK